MNFTTPARRGAVRIARLAFAAALFCAPFPGAVSAQQISGTSPQELNPAERTPPPQQSTSKGDLLSAPEPGPCELRGLSTKINLTDVTFQGADKISPDDFEPAYKDFIGRTVSIAAVCDIRDRASEILFRKGILARVEIPPQRMKGGAHLRLDVIEAYVASVEIHGEIGDAKGRVAAYVERLRGMRPFDIKLAQRYLYLASDIPGVHVSATLGHSPKGRGAIAMDIFVTRTSWQALLNVQNFGAQSAGPFGATLRADFNSFTGLGERTSLVGYSTLDGNEQRVIQGVEEFRIGGGGLLANFSLAYGTTNPGGNISILGLNGNSLVGEASLTYPIVRSRRTNIELSEGFDFIQQNINLGTFALTRDRLRIFNAKISGGYNWRGSIPGSFNIDVEARKGVTALGSSHAGDPDLSRVEGRPDAFEVRSAGTLDVNWLPYLSTHGAYQAQYANAPLLAYEELPVGNLTIGRGYDPAVVSGDNGVEGSFELRLGSFPVFRQFGVSAMGFFDAARVTNLDSGGQDVTLRSTGAGLGFQFASVAHLDVTYAHTLDRVSPFIKTPPSRVLMNFTVGY